MEASVSSVRRSVGRKVSRERAVRLAEGAHVVLVEELQPAVVDPGHGDGHGAV
jgi:hypothetical protein